MDLNNIQIWIKKWSHFSEKFKKVYLSSILRNSSLKAIWKNPDVSTV